MKHKVTVYGSLLQGLGNYPLLERHNAKRLGEFKTEPKFTMISLGGFPGVVKNGTTAIHAEVYEVDDNCLASLDGLEGFRGEGKHNFYDRETIDTPFGESFIYFLHNANIVEKSPTIVGSGDWKNWREERTKLYE